MNSDRADLEAKVMFLERSLEVLNEAMVDQGRVMEAFERRVKDLESKVDSKSEPDIGPHDDAPPHYS